MPYEKEAELLESAAKVLRRNADELDDEARLLREKVKSDKETSE